MFLLFLQLFHEINVKSKGKHDEIHTSIIKNSFIIHKYD